MSETDIIANIARGFAREPAAVAAAPAPGRISAAIWTYDGEDAREVTADPDPSLHMIYLQLKCFDADMFLDGRLAWTRRMRPGSLGIVSAGLTPRAIQYGRMASLHLYVPTSLIDEMASEGLGQPRRAVELIDPECLSADPSLYACARELEREMRDPTFLSQLRIDVLAQDFAIHLVRHHAGLRLPARAPSAPNPDDWRLKRAMDMLEADLMNDPGLDDLAARVSLSPRRLTMLFRAAVGMGPHRWLVQRRLERARDLLADPRRSVTEVAFACGFASTQHFATTFRAHVGTTPSEYRRQRRL